MADIETATEKLKWETPTLRRIAAADAQWWGSQIIGGNHQKYCDYDPTNQFGYWVKCWYS